MRFRPIRDAPWHFGKGSRSSAVDCVTRAHYPPYLARTAGDGNQALEVAAGFRPQMAILDIGMPGLNGYELARRIRNEPWGRGMLLAALTGWGQQEDVQRAAAAGFDHHMTKPADFDAVTRLIDWVAGRSRTFVQ